MSTSRTAIHRSDLPVRAASGVAMILVSVGAIVAGGYPFLLLVGAAGVLMAAEWAGLMHASPRGQWLTMAGVVASLLAVAPHVGLSPAGQLGAVAAAVVAVSTATGRPSLGLGVAYAALPVVALIQIRYQPDGITLAFWTLAIVWATDTGAYFAGRAIGGPRLAPKLSPNKTWAGLIGGMAAALAVGFVIAWTTNVPFRLASLAGLLAVAAQAGDLFESWLKRRAGVKDSGRLLPGHGGVLDRLDGAVPVACIVAVLLASGFV